MGAQRENQRRQIKSKHKRGGHTSEGGQQVRKGEGRGKHKRERGGPAIVNPTRGARGAKKSFRRLRKCEDMPGC